jgi:hypothetical protein
MPIKFISNGKKGVIRFKKNYRKKQETPSDIRSAGMLRSVNYA